MASHGIPRAGAAEPRTEQGRKKELQKIEEYQDLVNQVNEKIRGRQYTNEVLRLTSKLLTLNPEYYTVWNHRRLLLQHRFREQASVTVDQEDCPSTVSSGHNAVIEIISDDLQFLIPLLRKYPKCYWIWNYRLWLLENSTGLLPTPTARRLWQEELGLVSKMLSLDSRNFLGWGYRRTVVAALESDSLKIGEDNNSMVEQEFRYTTKMIESNLSNFSAWHSRSKLIPRLLDERAADETARQRFLDDELVLIQEALYTDPYDQSLWFYHNNLMGTFDPHLCQHTMAYHLTPHQRLEYITREIGKILEMLDGAEDCKWIYQSLIQLSTMYKASSGAWPSQAAGMGSWVSELRTLDPLRIGRWTDLDRALQSQVDDTKVLLEIYELDSEVRGLYSIRDAPDVGLQEVLDSYKYREQGLEYVCNGNLTGPNHVVQVLGRTKSTTGVKAVCLGGQGHTSLRVWLKSQDFGIPALSTWDLDLEKVNERMAEF